VVARRARRKAVAAAWAYRRLAVEGREEAVQHELENCARRLAHAVRAAAALEDSVGEIVARE
jgi:hypothetical protein